MINPDEKAVLRDFARVALKHGIPFVLVGAGARLLALDWQYDLQSERTTDDWDLAVEVRDWETFNSLKQALIEGSGGSFAQDRGVHRFRHSTGVPIDLIPFGGVEDQDGVVIWPQDGNQLVAHGFSEVLENAVPLDVGENVIVPIATVAGLAVLKAFAFHNRNHGDDLRDLYFLIRNYAHAGNEERIFDELSAYLASGKLEYEFAGARLLGIDVQRLCHPETIRRLDPIVGKFVYPYASHLNPLIISWHDEAHEERERIHIARMFQAFKAGIEGSLVGEG